MFNFRFQIIITTAGLVINNVPILNTTTNIADTRTGKSRGPNQLSLHTRSLTHSAQPCVNVWCHNIGTRGCVRTNMTARQLISSKVTCLAHNQNGPPLAGGGGSSWSWQRQMARTQAIKVTSMRKLRHRQPIAGEFCEKLSIKLIVIIKNNLKLIN